jgi:hypothetical protein
MFFDSNQSTGTIPSEIGSLFRVTYLSLYENQLTGTIPSQIGSMARLNFLYLGVNQLTGNIPPTIGSLSLMSYLGLENNQFTGNIPSEISSLSRLGSLLLSKNQLTGNIHSVIGNFSRLSYLYLYQNQLTGTIPYNIGSLSRLITLYLDSNQLTGTIPSSISNLANLVNFHLHQNLLNGPITFQLTSFAKLQQLFLQQNSFTGSLSLLFSSSNGSLSSSKLFNLDVSDNLFSNSIPSTLFLLPQLQSISLSLNCFEHELPVEICGAMSAEVISMDGLGSAMGCQNVVTLPFTSVILVRSLVGEIPPCVWSLSNLETLNLAGNGLKGRIGSASSMLSLVNLTLSHNYLSGEIPLWLQKKEMVRLDLSHNKLTGDVDGFKHQYNFNNSQIDRLINDSSKKSLTLVVNRLSGDLSSSAFGKYVDLDILSGNLFGCDNLPKNDQNSESLSCGSEQYDQAAILMAGVLGLIACVIVLYQLLCLFFAFGSQDETNYGMFVLDSKPLSKFFRHARYYKSHPFPSNLRSQPKGEIKPPSPAYPLSAISFGILLSRLIWSACFVTLLSFLLSLPIYVLKELDVESTTEKYITHTHMYNWVWTLAYVSGTIPAIILLLTGFICLSYFIFVMNRLGGNDDISTWPNPEIVRHDFLSLIVWAIFLLNIAVVGTVNGLYIWSTLLDIASDIRIWIQVLFALFSFLWIVLLRRGLPSHIRESRYGVWLLICLNVMNTVVIPCIVTALSTPTCYQVSHTICLLFADTLQRMLVPPEDISSSYSYQRCTLIFLIGETSECVQYSEFIMDELKITPPFFYSYQCGSTLLTSYIPVHMYSTTLRVFTTLGALFTIFLSSNKKTYPPWLVDLFPGICWPSQFIEACSDVNKTKPIRLIKPHQIISRTMNSLVLLLSFGLCSPILCGYVTLSICMDLFTWLVLIGRFLEIRMESLDKSSLISPSSGEGFVFNYPLHNLSP